MLNSEITTERSDLHRLVSIAARAAISQTIDGVDQCIDIMRHLKSLSLSVDDILGMYREILPLESLRDHENQKIRMGANALFDTWMKTLYSSRKNTSSPCNKAPPTKLLKKPSELSSKLKKKKFKRSVTHAIVAAENNKTTEFLGLQKSEDQRSRAKAVCEIKKNFNNTDDCKSFAAKLSEIPCKSVPAATRPANKQHSQKLSEHNNYCPVLRKNATEMLELFEIAKKSADVANAKGLSLAKKETSICVDTLYLLVSFPISSTAPETRKIMDKLERLTKHKDRKICNSASALLYHWMQSIRDQQLEDDHKVKDSVTR